MLRSGTRSRRRSRPGWTAADLSRATGISYPHVSNIIRGARPIGDEAGTAIALALGLPPETLARRFSLAAITSGSIARGAVVMPQTESLIGWYSLEIAIPGIAPDHLVHIVPWGDWAPGRFLVVRYPDSEMRLRRAEARDEGRWLVDENGDSIRFDPQRHTIVGRVSHELKDHDQA